MSSEPEFTKKNNDDWPALKSSQLGDLLGLSDRRVRQYAEQKVLPRNPDKTYPQRESIRAFIDFLRSNASGSVTVQDLNIRKLKAETEEREAKAEKAQLDLDVRRGELISRKDMYREWISRCVELRSSMMGLANQVGFRFTDGDVRSLVEEVVEAFVTETLETWSREGPYSPKEKTGTLDAPRTQSPEAAAET